MSVSTHVLDTVAGRPASGVAVSLSYLDSFGEADGEWTPLDDGETDADGRHLFGAPTEPGIYQLTFDTGMYFAAAGVETFYPQVTITFEVADPAAHYHVPLLLSPFGYSTYRGS